MNTFSLPYFSKKSSECSKVFLECIICYDELEEASSSCQPLSLTLEACINTKKLRRALIESSQHFDTLGFRKPIF